MKKISKIIGISALALVISLSIACMTLKTSRTSKINLSAPTTTTSLTRELLLRSIEQEERAVDQALAQIGITLEKRKAARKKYYVSYMKSDIPDSTMPISKKTKLFIKQVAKEFGLDIRRIKILGYDEFSPAAATQRILYVNETRLLNLSESAQRFVLGHEMQHILHSDTFERYILATLCNAQIEQTEQNKAHPILQCLRFHERRADIKTALHNEGMADAYVAFAKEQLQFGDTPGITHPKNSDRLQLAERIASIQPSHTIV
jgi:predicted metal-dependent hydrolase